MTKVNNIAKRSPKVNIELIPCFWMWLGDAKFQNIMLTKTPSLLSLSG